MIRPMRGTLLVVLGLAPLLAGCNFPCYANSFFRPARKEPRSLEILEIHVNRDGTCRMGDRAFAEPQLAETLRRFADKDRGPDGISEGEILIRADENTEWKNVQKIMWHAQDAGFYRIKLGTLPAAEEKPIPGTRKPSEAPAP